MDNLSAEPPKDEPSSNHGKPVNEGFAAAQRALKLKWAKVRGWANKDGTPVSEEDKAWYEGTWIAGHPDYDKPREPKAKGGGDKPERVRRVPDPEPEYADPTPNAKPPKVDIEPKAPKGKGKAGGDEGNWQSKYKTKIVVPGIGELTPGQERELMCVQGAAMIAGLTKACEDALATIGAKPYLNMSTETIFGAWVLTLDKVLPDVKPEPEHLAIVGTACIVTPVLLNLKAIRKARGTQATEAERKAKLASMREATERAEREHKERQEREARTQPEQAAPPQEASASTPAPQAAVEPEPMPPSFDMRPLPQRGVETTPEPDGESTKLADAMFATADDFEG